MSYSMKQSILFMLLLSTTPQATSKTSRSTKKSNYYEDLACHCINFTEAPANARQRSIRYKAKKFSKLSPMHDITQQLQDLLADLKAYYAMIDSVQGYTVQVYVGSSRKLAFQIKNKLHTNYPYLNPEVQYKQPNFTVQIGRFLDRLEAYKLYVPIKAIMSHAIIRPTYFPNQPGIFYPNYSLLPEASINKDQHTAIPSA